MRWALLQYLPIDAAACFALPMLARDFRHLVRTLLARIARRAAR